MWGEGVKCEQNMGSCGEEFSYWERDKMWGGVQLLGEG